MFKKQGMYDPAYEHDACGVGLLANINGSKSHEIVEKGLQVLENMEHRGAEGADERTGDGAGIMVQIPHEFILLQGIPVPEKGRYGVAMVFLPKDESDQYFCIDVFKQEISKAELNLITTRDVPVNSDILGVLARAAEPDIKQLFITSQHYMTQEELDRTLYLVRRRVENRIAQSDIASKDDFYVCSLSTRVVIYKGMLISRQLRQYYPDLLSPWFTSGLALVHSRFSTNTSPRWPLAQPFRFLGHNGEINTIRGNRSWMHARETVLDPGKLGGMKDLTPIVQEGMSDSASFDNVFEFFVESGMSIPHVLAMMVPESFNDKNPIPQDLKDFFEYHSIMMEPWDGPAALLFSDGKYAGGMLDRNGLRPCRYLITKDGMLMMASETGVLSFDGSEIAEKCRLQPGKILLVDLETGKITYDALLYVPAHAPYDLYSDTYEKGLQLYSKGVFIKDKCKELVPDYLKFVKGLVDSPSFSLNISREMLQQSPLLEKISENVEKKVIDKLKGLKNNDFDKYLNFWKAFGEHLKFGIYQTYGAKKDLLQDLLVFHSLLNEDKYISLSEYKEKMAKKQKYIYYVSGENLDAIKLLPQIEKYKKDGVDVLLLDQKIDEFCIMMMREYDKIEFKNISDENVNELTKEEQEKIDNTTADSRRLLDNIKEALNGEVDDVVISSKLVDSPVCISTKDGLSLEMEKTLNEQPGASEQGVKSVKVLELNPDHELFKAFVAIQDQDELVKNYASILLDEAMLLEGRDIKDRSAFIKKMNELLVKALSR